MFLQEFEDCKFSAVAKFHSASAIIVSRLLSIVETSLEHQNYRNDHIYIRDVQPRMREHLRDLQMLVRVFTFVRAQTYHSGCLLISFNLILDFRRPIYITQLTNL